ncbi:MAG TPA: PorP/SprF family type IX secretion system membrane protein [Chryseolinea sp.]|nr:PorP/SprF family type IX secretion system membrane protein [Chryseolinea sp.]
MKKFLPIVILFAGLFQLGYSQDVPVYSQKLTNSFLYNPSVAGNTLGSATLSYRQQWAGVEGSPRTLFFSIHTPFAKHRFGTGFNVYQEKSGVTDNLFASGAFAYHLRFTDDNMLSMGVSVEYLNTKIDYMAVDVIDGNDDLLNGNQPNANAVDFSFGLNYSSKYFKVGASANRLGSLVGLSDSTSQFSQFYSGFLNLTLPLAGERDLLEPIVYLRKFANGTHQIDGGLYYTYKNVLTLGGSYRTGGAIGLTAAVRINKNLLIGYSREILSGDFSSSIGASNEFTLRLDFRDHNYYTKKKNAREISSKALALRRKTLSSPSKGSAFSRSQKYKNKLKRNYIKSPNYRMESSKKLQTKKIQKKKSAARKKPRRKPR